MRTSSPAPNFRGLNVTDLPSTFGATSQTSQPGVRWPGLTGRRADASICARPNSGPLDLVAFAGGCQLMETGHP